MVHWHCGMYDGGPLWPPLGPLASGLYLAPRLALHKFQALKCGACACPSVLYFGRKSMYATYTVTCVEDVVPTMTQIKRI
jgi:hypothetical protein